MWIEEAEELLKGYLPYYLLVFVPIFIIVSPANPVAASHEFPVCRMQHYDLHGVAHGCRSAMINLEIRSINSWSTSRHCVAARLQELTVDHFRNIRSKAGALLVILPADLSMLSSEEQQHLLLLESAMLAQEITIPVYFAPSSLELDRIVEEVAVSSVADDRTKSASEVMLSSIAATGYQIVINPKTPTVRADVKIASVQGNLVGHGRLHIDGKVPTIAVVAYYDSFGVAPDLSFGADSNASGVAVLLELMRVFALLYSDPKTHGMYNIVFLLSGGGKLNFQGSKKWLEDQLDSLDGSIIQEASYVMCLDALAADNALFMHVSKPPKDGSPASTLFKHLKSSADFFGYEKPIEGVHKKINLADDLLAWEHERYSIRRLPAFTLSSLKSHKDMKRGSILDTRPNLDVEQLVQNAQILADALSRSIYNVSGSVFGESLKIEKSSLEAWVDHLSQQPRAAQLLSHKDNALVTLFKDTFAKYLRDVKVTYAVPDKRDPDFVFYDVTKGTMNIYSVKPAFFDLILTLGIVGYLVLIYFAIQHFPVMYTLACNATRKHKTN